MIPILKKELEFSLSIEDNAELEEIVEVNTTLEDYLINKTKHIDVTREIQVMAGNSYIRDLLGIINAKLSYKYKKVNETVRLYIIVIIYAEEEKDLEYIKNMIKIDRHINECIIDQIGLYLLDINSSILTAYPKSGKILLYNNQIWYINYKQEYDKFMFINNVISNFNNNNYIEID